jgi:hypothetical protein
VRRAEDLAAPVGRRLCKTPANETPTSVQARRRSHHRADRYGVMKIFSTAVFELCWFCASKH